MRARPLLPVLLLTGSCVANNADYDPQGQTTEASTGTTASSGPDGTTSVADDTTGSGETEGVDVRCESDLYAVNEASQLFVLDVDSGRAELVLSEIVIASWAIATHPDGTLYVSRQNDQVQIRTVDPTTFISQGGTALDVAVTQSMDRATFTSTGTMWLASTGSGQHVAFDAGLGAVTNEFELVTTGISGDMVLYSDEIALVIDGSGTGHSLEFGGQMVGSITIEDRSGVLVDVTGLAKKDGTYDILWASTKGGSIVELELLEDFPNLTYSAGRVIVFDDVTNIDDLAPVLVHPPECP